MENQIAAIVETAVDVKRLSREIHAAHVALQDCDRLLDATEAKAEGLRQEQARRRLELGRLLVEARKAWPARGPRAKGWGEFLAAEGIAERTARDYMQLAGYVEEISATGTNVAEISVPTYADVGIDRRPRLGDAETQPDPGERYDPAFGASRPADSVSGVADYESDEWYTPIELVEAAREVLGKIDLDPATCEFAQKRIQAARYFTREDDGLTKLWCGRIWLNPPFSPQLARRFADKLIAEWRAGRVTSAVMIQNASTDTGWFHALAAESSICLTRGRINFDREDGRGLQNRYGQVLFYLGRDTQRFEDVFARFGLVGRLRRAMLIRLSPLEGVSER